MDFSSESYWKMCSSEKSSEKQAWKEKKRAQNMGEVEEILRMKGYSRNTAVYHA